jgi:ABC-2 type transport system permease protein
MTQAATLTSRPAIRKRGSLELLAHQIRYEQLSFWRNPQSAIFTFIFPVALVIIFGAVFNGVKPSSYYDGLTPFQYYIPTIAAVSVLGACYSQLAIGLAVRRQTGILKRTRATPLPAWTYFAGLVAHSVVISIIEVALIVTIGRLYGVAFPHHWAAMLVTLILGAASFCTLGVGVASLISNADAAPAVVQFILFPMIFLSGTYFPIHAAVLNDIAGILPLRPFNQALMGAFAHTGVNADHLLLLLAWGAAGAAVAVRRFRWDPRPE